MKTLYTPELAWRYYPTLLQATQAVEGLVPKRSKTRAFSKFLDELVHSVGEEKFVPDNLNNIICRYGPDSLVIGMGMTNTVVTMTFEAVVRRRHLLINLRHSLVEDEIVTARFSVTVHRPGNVKAHQHRMSPELQAVLDGVWHCK